MTEIRELEGRIRTVEQQLKALAIATPLVARLRTIPGIGLLTATALVGFVSHGMLLIHGARAVLCHAKKAAGPRRLQHWALQLERLRGHNKAAVALANKLARIAWAVWTTGTPFRDSTAPPLAPAV